MATWTNIESKKAAQLVESMDREVAELTKKLEKLKAKRTNFVNQFQINCKHDWVKPLPAYAHEGPHCLNCRVNEVYCATQAATHPEFKNMSFVESFLHLCDI